jgi:hypothetical protein
VGENEWVKTRKNGKRREQKVTEKWLAMCRNVLTTETHCSLEYVPTTRDVEVTSGDKSGAMGEVVVMPYFKILSLHTTGEKQTKT